MLHHKLLVALSLTALVGPTIQPPPRPDVLPVLGTSRVVIHVGKAGAFGFAGHAHDVEAPVRGSISLDHSDPTRSEIVLEFDAAALRVTGKGEPPQDVPEVQRVMLSDRVLDASRYPRIVFRSHRLIGAVPRDGSFTVSVAGDLSLHGVTKPLVLPVRVTLREDSLTAEGTTTLKQTDFGIRPVTAAGGTVRVKDELDVTFSLHAGKPLR